MSELTVELRAAATSSQSLRAAALSRFLNRAAKEAKAAAARHLEELRAALDRAHVRVEHRQAVNTAIDSTRESTEAKLTAVVVECFAGILDAPELSGSPSTALRHAYAARAEEFEAAFQSDVAQVTDELQQLIEGLPPLKVEKPKQAASGRVGSSKSGASGPEFDVQKATTSLRELGRQGVEVHLGAPIGDVQAKLRGLAGLEGDELAAALKKAGFDSVNDAEAAKRLIGRFEQASRVLDAGPQAVALVELIRDYRRGKLDQKAVERVAGQQDELIAELVATLMEGEPDGYGTRLERLRATALAAFGDAVEDEDRMRSEVEDLEARVAALEQSVLGLRH
jgi:nitrogen fixation protein FixH